MIETIPAKYSRRRLLLDQIAQAFEPGVRYPERDVSLFLCGLHPDYAALRRYLVDEEPLTRAGGAPSSPVSIRATSSSPSGPSSISASW
jgi:hypothetical protein